LTPTAAAARFPIGFDNRAWTPDVQVYQNTNLVFVPAGCYLSISADASVQPEEICVESYWLGQYEVTNAAYAACVNAGVCSPPASFASSTRLNYYDSPAFADFPIINVTWQQATDYAVWLGGRLPTSSEWRYAAQGPANFLYPWGSDEPTETRLNFNGLLQDTSRVGLLPDGASWVGALDMAGNVWEWVDPSADISANLFEDDAVIVGGSWNSFGSLVQGSYAAPKPRDSRDVFTGFRVAFDADVFERLDSN
jgi:formylglycine-generating enzyme required for sulfatase activity